MEEVSFAIENYVKRMCCCGDEREDLMHGEMYEFLSRRYKSIF